MFKKNLPIKRVVIAGCRDYNNYDEAKKYIDFCLSNIRKENNIIILSGCASGADAIGERYAKENGLRIEKHPAKWKKYGRAHQKQRNGGKVRFRYLPLGRKKQGHTVNDFLCKGA